MKYDNTMQKEEMGLEVCVMSSKSDLQILPQYYSYYPHTDPRLSPLTQLSAQTRTHIPHILFPLAMVTLLSDPE